MPSFEYQKKIKQEFLEEKKKKNVGPYCSKCWNWEFWTYFFTEINVFVITQRVKYRKKVPFGTGTEFQVPIPVPVQMWTVPNPIGRTTWWVVAPNDTKTLHH